MQAIHAAETIEKVRRIIMEGRRVTIQEIAHEEGIITVSVHSSLTEDLGMWLILLTQSKLPDLENTLFDRFLTLST